MRIEPVGSEPDIIEKLKDLKIQATSERSHFYVASCCEEAIREIESLRRFILVNILK